MRGTNGNPNITSEVDGILESMIIEFCKEFDIDEHVTINHQLLPKLNILTVDPSWKYIGNSGNNGYKIWKGKWNDYDLFAEADSKNNVIGYVLITQYKGNIWQLKFAFNNVMKSGAATDLLCMLLGTGKNILSDDKMTELSEKMFLSFGSDLYSYDVKTGKETPWTNDMSGTYDDPRTHRVKPFPVYWLIK